MALLSELVGRNRLTCYRIGIVTEGDLLELLLSSWEDDGETKYVREKSQNKVSSSVDGMVGLFMLLVPAYGRRSVPDDVPCMYVFSVV